MSTTTKLRGCFVTGTDTGIGKTRISAALLHWCNSQGWRSAGFKPVAAGTELINGEQVNDDVMALHRMSSVPLTTSEVGPYQFRAACAPHLAAQLEGRIISHSTVLQAAQLLAARADLLVVEGVGGFCVPLGPDWDSADLAVDLGLPVLLVVGLRLGCLNHALLTAEAISARGLRLAGWVGNRIDPGMPWAEENIASLKHELARRHAAPCFGLVPWLSHAEPAATASYLEHQALRVILQPLTSD